MIELDLNVSTFQHDLFELENPEILALFKTFHKIRTLSWQQLYNDAGLNWELIGSAVGPGAERVYSLRVNKKFRILAARRENALTPISLHPDHDSAY